MFRNFTQFISNVIGSSIPSVIASVTVTLTGSLLIISTAHAALILPQGLNKNDRQTVLEVLGFGTATKILSSPYPLGGYPGLEFGIAYEIIPVSDLASLGTKTKAQNEFEFPRFSFGKGLYNNIDIFIHFIPVTDSTGSSNYGGHLRWIFHHATWVPATVSLIVHGNSATLQDRFATKTFGADFVSGIYVDNQTFYVGLGIAKADAIFIGGPDGITDTGHTLTEEAQKFHTIIGASVRLNKYFLSFQMDRYVQPNYGLKLGYRY